MTGYLKALCSILGTLLCLALIASPGAAQKKKKKAADDAPAAEASADAEAGGSLDSLMESAAEKKKKGKEPAEEEKAEEPAEEEIAEPDAWERPPVEEKAPAKEVAPPPAEPRLENPFSAALLLGYGFMTDRRGGGADPYGLMAGLRGGYTFDFKLYAGLFYNYYLGSSKTGDSQGTGIESETTANYMHFGAEVGYDAEIGPVQFRPSVQLGVALVVTDVTGVTDSFSDFMFAPGATVVYPIDNFFIGGDLRGQIVTGDGVSAITLAATGGLRF